MSKLYKNNYEEIRSLRSQIDILRWDEISGAIPSYYAWEAIDRIEARINELKLLIEDSLIAETRKIG